MAEADRWFEPVPATVIQDCSFALQESEIPVEGAIGFKSPGKEQGVGATSESLLSTDYKAYEGFAIALLPSAVPGDLIVGPPLMELCKLRFAQAYGRNLVCVDRCSQLSLTLSPQFGTHASRTKQASKH